MNSNNNKNNKFDICFYFVEANHRSIFCKFFLRWLNGKKNSAKFVNFEVIDRKSKFHKNVFLK